MTPRRAVSAARLATLALAVAACGGSTLSPGPSVAPSGGPSTSPSIGPSPSTVPSPSAATAGLLLKVTSEGGFINPSANLAALPTVAVYTDGRILTPGVIPAIEPGPLVPPVSVRDVGAAGVAAILAAIKSVGLDGPASAGPGVPGDSGTDVFTVVVDGATTTSHFSGGGGGVPGHPGGPVASGGDERAAALALLDRLLDPAETWGGPANAPTTYLPTAYRVYVAPGGPVAEPAASQSPVVWPLATPLATFGTPAVPDRGIAGLRQGAVVGADAVTLAPALDGATALTPFTSAGMAFTLYIRPLLPDEIGG